MRCTHFFHIKPGCLTDKSSNSDRSQNVVNICWTTVFILVHSPASARGSTMKYVKQYSEKASLPLVLMHVAFITFLSISMVMSIPTLR